MSEILKPKGPVSLTLNQDDFGFRLYAEMPSDFFTGRHRYMSFDMQGGETLYFEYRFTIKETALYELLSEPPEIGQGQDRLIGSLGAQARYLEEPAADE